MAAEAIGWSDALLVETFVDDRPWRPSHDAASRHPPGESWEGRNVDLVFAACHGDWEAGGLAPGRHRARMQARLPGTTTVITTGEVEVDIRCDARYGLLAALSDGDGGVSIHRLLVLFALVGFVCLVLVLLWRRRRSRADRRHDKEET